MKAAGHSSEEMDLPEDGLLGFEAMLDMDSGGCGNESMDDLLQSLHTCTHRHFCNPPGPDNTHTHVCSHTHTQLLTAPELSASTGDTSNNNRDTVTGKKRPLGNREAVRKYREKKKAHTAQLEEQLEQQHAINQQLLRRLQAQSALEAEVVRLRAVLADIKGKVDGELGLAGGAVLGNGAHRGEKASAVRLIPISADQSPLPGGQFYLQTVDLPCEPRHACGHQSSRVLRSHQGSPPWPACDVGHNDCLRAKREEARNAQLCSTCPPLSGLSTTSQRLQGQASVATGLENK